MPAQLAPDALQRRHEYAYRVGLPDHVPGDAVSVAASTADPEIVGLVRFVGAEPAATAPPETTAAMSRETNRAMRLVDKAVLASVERSRARAARPGYRSVIVLNAGSLVPAI